MIPQSFEYFAPKTLPEAISLLTKYGEDAKVLAGGHSLIPLMKLRLAAPSYLIDINHIPGLEYIKEDDGFLKIGALTREVELESSGLITKKFPIILDTARVIADPLVRNMATVGGNLAHGDPANDHPATMLALEAQIVATGSKSSRTIPIDEFFEDLMTTQLEPDEILTEIQIPLPPKNSGGAYFKLERKVGDFAVVGVAAQLTLESNGSCQKAGIGLTNVGLTPIKARKAEAHLKGKSLQNEIIKEAGRLAAEESEPTSDLRGSEEYKRDMVDVLTRRALSKALFRAKGGN